MQLVEVLGEFWCMQNTLHGSFDTPKGSHLSALLCLTRHTYACYAAACERERCYTLYQPRGWTPLLSLQQPLFHFLLVSLAKWTLAGSVGAFDRLVSVWLSVLQPWNNNASSVAELKQQRAKWCGGHWKVCVCVCVLMMQVLSVFQR